MRKWTPRTKIEFSFKVEKYTLHVLVVPTLKELRDHFIYHSGKNEAAAAFAAGQGRMLGEIVLAYNKLNLYVIAHEATHAAIEFQRRVLADPENHDVLQDPEEEILCYAVGGICETIHNELSRRGIKINLEDFDERV